jgi:hypothetical protein
MTLSNKMSEITQRFVDVMRENALSWGIQEVLDGPYQLIGGTPAICVEPNRTERDWSGAAGVGTMRARDIFKVIINVHHGRLQDAATNHRQCMERAELVVAKIHEDKQLNGLVVHGWVVQEQYGISRTQQSLLWTTRLDWQGQSEVIV